MADYCGNSLICTLFPVHDKNLENCHHIVPYRIGVYSLITQGVVSLVAREDTIYSCTTRQAHCYALVCRSTAPGMQTTFRNTERQHLRRKELDRHLALIQNAGLDCEMEMFSENADLSGFADDVAGHPLSKSLPPSDASVSSARRRLPRGRIAAVVVAILVLVTVMLSLLPVSQGNAPSVADTSEALRYRHLFSLILDFEITKQKDLENVHSPQAQALHWLAYEDGAQDVEDLRTRFSLATLFLGTRSNATSWVKQDNWLTSASVCQWYGVSCWKTHTNVHLVQALNLSSNGLDGTIPEEVALLQRDCEMLDLSYNSIRGPIPIEIGKQMKNLKRLYLGPNPLSSTIPETMFQLSMLTHLYIDSAELRGTIPNAIGKMTSLHGLGLHQNSLTGTIPKFLGSLTGLRVLNLDENLLKGSIPESLGSLTGLVDLRLDQNSLTGSLPMTLAYLLLLEVLYLDNNSLDGSIPNLLAESWPFLTELQLYNNAFTGAVPSGLASAPFLRVIYLDGNNFTGVMPEAICERRSDGALEELWADCADPLKVVCSLDDCCTRCLPQPKIP